MQFSTNQILILQFSTNQILTLQFSTNQILRSQFSTNQILRIFTRKKIFIFVRNTLQFNTKSLLLPDALIILYANGTMQKV